MKNIITNSNHKPNFVDFTRTKNSHPTFILSLTRCCTQNCTFCAVDALYCHSITGCRDRAYTEQLIGRELTPDQWCSVIDKLITANPYAEFDLSGGDCLALPWVYLQLIPHILERVQTRKQISVTSTATSIQTYFEETHNISSAQRPGAMHVTFDGCREYSFENIRLAAKINEFEMDLHVECPLTVENCTPSKIQEIFLTAKNAHVSEILLMRYFPVGRGSQLYGLDGLNPSPNMYRFAIHMFLQLASQHPDGPTIKVQCALKQFSNQQTGVAQCKMGDGTWCVMPNGALLICPWAYGLEGNPLDDTFVAGNILRDEYGECRSRAQDLRATLHRKYPMECRVIRFVDENNHDPKNRDRRHQWFKERILA